MTNRFKLLMGVVVLSMLAAGQARAARDWKYFSRYMLSVPLETNPYRSAIEIALL